MQFGCFVQLEGLRGRNEGLVHISEVHTHLYDTDQWLTKVYIQCMYDLWSIFNRITEVYHYIRI